MPGKAFDTLVLLVENRGRLIDKDELLSRVWAGSVVEESSLSHSIFVLRKILGDNRKNPNYITTVAGRGYQFVAPVTEHTNGTALMEAAPVRRRRFWHRPRSVQFAIAGAMLAALAGVAFWLTEKTRTRDASEPRLSHFTSYPGVETMPAFSPDGKQIAYVRGKLEPVSWVRGQVGQANIYTKLIGAETELRLTNHAGTDYYPAWSPDGQYIAYYRDEAGASGIYVVSALGGHERRITSEDGKFQGIVWLSDGHHLVISRLFEGSQASPLIEISLDTGVRRQMTFPPPGPGGDAFPALSEDRRTLAFIRSTSTENSVCFMGLSSNRTIQCWRLQKAWPEGLAWAGPSKGVIVAAIRDSGSRLWRYESGGAASVALTSGEQDAVLPAVSPQANRLAYVLSRSNTNLWELDRVGSPPANSAIAKPIDPSTRSEIDPSFSPDGRKVAFMSDRTGSQEIWVMDHEARTSVQLTHFGGPTAGAPSWSPDGSQIAFDSDCQIFVISSDGGIPRQLTTGGENCAPSWSRDGQFVYFGSSRSGEFQVWRVSAKAGETQSLPAVQITQGGGFRAFESADGKYLYYAKGRGKRGLWRRSLRSTSGSKEEPVLESLQAWGWWSLTSRVIYFMELSHSIDPRVQLKTLDLTDGQIREITRLPYPVPSETPAIAASQDGQHVIYIQPASTDADIYAGRKLSLIKDGQIGLC
jgi:Tol biopolymer transport system component